MTMIIDLGTGERVQINNMPDECPICHSKITPLRRFSKSGRTAYGADVEITYQCPNAKCDELFIAYFRHTPTGVYDLFATRPVETVTPSFEEHIKEISSSFCEIYIESYKAEQLGLKQICGVGYRKALEFLIKDYIKKGKPEETDSIERKMLGPCIDEYISDEKIKQVAKRATWLGNDETHYQRRWVEKDLSDLKLMIQLTIHWLEAEYLTQKALESMPEGGRAT